ncbi:DUF262 domain-containing protein [Streptomyces heilongjiangensis]|uniref:DUF262 domain-containing protein n=1 Tax=Streptomyces heilongjiangensis TaxID=945052 RepID=A0ABW1BJC2_9ACTN|nr:DUF262 domain-containing protein [Streptomyces heilongjiangensis]MDC2952530.1 DUF262 domain-containing protein [Streptomyces heilongjiangensis]
MVGEVAYLVAMADGDVKAQFDAHEDVLTLEEQEDLAAAEHEAEPVTYTGTDFDVEGLVRRLKRGDIVIPTFGHGDDSLEVAGFQRGFVWRRPQMDRFIESLLMGYPIPGIMLVQQVDRRYLVLDGQQRLRTLAAFYEGIHAGREFALDNVADVFKGLTYRTLGPEQRRQLDNTFIQATIVKTDGSDQSLEAIYQVFERLNSGGTQLTPHEIRIALYPGALVDFLENLNKSPEWRQLYGARSLRLRDQELILRILALYQNSAQYFRPQKKFLNEFLGRHRNLEGLDNRKLEGLFIEASKLLLAGPGRSALRFQSSQVNAALAEALYVGLMRRVDGGSLPAPGEVTSAVRAFTSNSETASTISGSTATEEYVRKRLDLATREFARI